MALVIKSGDSADTLTIDPVSKAARVTSYVSDGFASSAPVGVYMVGVNHQVPSLSTRLNTFCLTNPAASGRRVIIRSMFFQRCSHGIDVLLNVSHGTNYAFTMHRATGVFSGGTTLTPGKMKTSFSSSVAVPRTRTTDITETPSGTYGESNLLLALPVQSRIADSGATDVASIMTYSMRHKLLDSNVLTLEQGESFLIRTGPQFQTGWGLYGHIIWEER